MYFSAVYINSARNCTVCEAELKTTHVGYIKLYLQTETVYTSVSRSVLYLFVLRASLTSYEETAKFVYSQCALSLEIESLCNYRTRFLDVLDVNF
jgi:hypothetical protein